MIASEQDKEREGGADAVGVDASTRVPTSSKPQEQRQPGDVYETGCWRGGAALWMIGLMEAYQSLKGI
jgi:hypothetical protein